MTKSYAHVGLPGLKELFNQKSESQTMDMDTCTARIKLWGIERGLDKADPFRQLGKLGEEFGELCEGMVKDDKGKIIDSLGDMYVVLTILSMQLGLNIEACINQAYNEIKDRKGEMRNGVYVKQEDLGEGEA